MTKTAPILRRHPGTRIAQAPVVVREVPSGELTRGENLAILSVGQVFDQFTGEELDGNIKSVDQLHAMVDYFERYQKPTGQLPIIDWNHRAIGNSNGASVDEQIPIGAALNLWVEGESLYATPGWTARGVKIKDAAEGLIHPSATYFTGALFDRATGEKIADGGLFAFAVTTTPATRVDKLGAIRSQQAAGAAEETVMNTAEDILAAIDGLDADALAQVKEALGMAEEPETRMDDEDEEPETRADDADDEVDARSDDALAAIVRAQGEKIAAFEKRERLKARDAACHRVKPALRAAAERIFDSEPDVTKAAALVKRHFKAEMVDLSTPAGAAGDRKGGADTSGKPPADVAGFTNFVKRNIAEGETFSSALERIQAEHPAEALAAFTTINGSR